MEVADVKKLLSVRETADYLNVGYKTAYRLVRKGEIPASKVGGSYRVDLDSLEAYLRRQRTTQEDGPGPQGELPEQRPDREPAGPVQAPQVATAVTCGLCRRVISVPAMAATCAEPGCRRQVCRICTGQDEHHCAEHRPTPAQLLQEARAAHARGDLPALVTAETAAKLEHEFCEGFRQRIQRTGGLRNPETGDMLNLAADRMEFAESEPERRNLAAGRSPLSTAVAAGDPCPSNRRVTCLVRSGRQRLLLVAQFQAHLVALQRRGFDTRPAGLEDLDQAARELQALANDNDAPVLATLASPTGWTDEAQRESMVADTTDDSGAIHILLLNAQTGRVQSVDTLPESLMAFQTLLEEEDPHAQRERVQTFVDDWFLLHDGIALDIATDELGLPQESVHALFRQIAQNDQYRYEKIARAGWVLYPDDNRY